NWACRFHRIARLRPLQHLDRSNRRFDMNLQSYLDEKGVRYRLSHHDTAFTASQLAEMEHVPGRMVVKPVIVNADGQFVMCALPASHRIDLDALKRQLEASEVSLAEE